MMKRWTVGLGATCAIWFVIGGPLVARANPDAASATATGTQLSPSQMTAMHAKMAHVETLIEKINMVYHTQFALAPKMESMAMAHMAAANMEMSKAMMEMQEFWSATPPAAQYPIPRGGQ